MNEGEVVGPNLLIRYLKYFQQKSNHIFKFTDKAKQNIVRFPRDPIFFKGFTNKSYKIRILLREGVTPYPLYLRLSRKIR